MDNAALRQGIRPESLHGYTIGNNILVREKYASNVRILREKLIHTQQQVVGLEITDEHSVIAELELDARYQLLEHRYEWALADEEVAQIKQEIATIEERGRY